MSDVIGQFDLRTDIREPRTGKIVTHQPYVMHVSKTEGTYFERPPGSKKFFNTKGEEIADPKAPVETEKKKPEVTILTKK